MILSEVQVKQFKLQGYTVAPGFFSPREVAAFQGEVERLKRQGRLRNVATEGDGATHSIQKANLQICPMYRESTLIRALPFDAKVTGAVTQLIGDRVSVRLDQCFLKPARNGSGTNWHQDNAYFKIADPMRGMAMWIAVHDATIANGTIHVIPNKIYDVLEHSRDPESDHHIRCYPNEEEAVACEVEAGGVVFFCYGTPHCTLGNSTEKDRAGIAVHFFDEEISEKMPRDKNGHPRPVLTGPNTTGGLNEYGERLIGTWEQEVEKTLQQAYVNAI